ncbi:mitochondrial small ribosomal subunit protein uS17m [Candidatus Peregrinibacteria bacterium]|nr:mitochondrial small ribosomal subunit protein uS17m [Candidatus Peregrinibacteria bacterium]
MKPKKGIITSARMTGTVVVTVHRFVLHPLYKKQYRRSKKFLADPGDFDLHEGDEVEVAECRPLSKRKCFRIINLIKAAPRVSEVREESELEEAMHRKGVSSPALS